MIAGLPAAVRFAGRRMGWWRTAGRWIGRIAVAALRLALSFTGWVGVAVFLATHQLPWWVYVLISVPLGIAGPLFFFLPLRHDASGRRAVVFWTCRALAVACAFALYIVLGIAVQNLELQEHGVVERAVVTGVSTSTNDSGGAPVTTYFYSLRALSGPAIHGTLAGDGTLSVGEQVTVRADPRGRAYPVLDTHVSGGGELLASYGLAGAVALLLAVAAWTWPQRPGREYGGAWLPR